MAAPIFVDLLDTDTCTNVQSQLDFTFSAPTTDDLIVIAAGWVNASGDTTDATMSATGYTEAVADNRSGSGSNEVNGVSILYRVSDGTETSATAVLTGNRKCNGAIFRFRNNATTTPLDKTNSNDNSSSVNSITTNASGVLTQAEEIGVAVACWGHDDTTADSWTTGESGWTEVHSIIIQGGSGKDCTVATAYKITSATTSIEPTHNITGPATDVMAAIATFLGEDSGGGSGRIMSSLAGAGGMAHLGGIAGIGGGLAG